MKCIQGTVVHGAGEGRRIGYPTANLDTDSHDIATGIYAGHTNLHGTDIQLPTAVVARPFNDGVRIEAHILDWEEDIYETAITICLVEKVREWHDFDTTEELQDQISQDIRVILSRLKQAE